MKASSSIMNSDGMCEPSLKTIAYPYSFLLSTQPV